MSETTRKPVRSALDERYSRFLEKSFPKLQSRYAEVANGQTPQVLFVSCSDSRVVPNILLDAEPGDVFECRIVGNIIPAYGSAFGGVSATLEYAVTVLKVDAVLICGHSDCGAMKALAASEQYDSLKPVSEWLHHADAAKRITESTVGKADTKEKLRTLTRENVLAQIRNAQTHPAVAVAMRHGLEVIGWVYDIETGAVEAYDPKTDSFSPLQATAVAK